MFYDYEYMFIFTNMFLYIFLDIWPTAYVAPQYTATVTPLTN